MRLTLTRPDDWHLHLRDGPMLATVAGFTTARFGRALVMPNLNPPVVTVADALAYRRRILGVLPTESGFSPLMALYLTPSTSPDDLRQAAETPEILGVKLYPAGATTNAQFGVDRIEGIYPLLEVMEGVDLPLMVHGEVTDPEVDVFDREACFVEQVLSPIVDRFPGLRVVLEHVTTDDGVEFIKAASDRVAATITCHHILLNRNALFEGGLRPHHYCLPVLKRERHRQAVLAAATSGNPGFFLGSDSAPHPKSAKESGCGCAGLFTAPGAMELYAEAFEGVDALDRLDRFASQFGADFYGLPRNSGTLTLEREPQPVPPEIGQGEEVIVPFRAGENLPWRVVP
ncbi:MAG: dihydroorotase [Gammaproteobacteria bacterium]|nr:dihydroorotase [Gammaproteobacteria bacterium]